jgi:hypothetical protein
MRPPLDIEFVLKGITGTVIPDKLFVDVEVTQD